MNNNCPKCGEVGWSGKIFAYRVCSKCGWECFGEGKQQCFTREQIQPLVEALVELSICPVCEGTGKWHPECPACLAGEPSYCTCNKEEDEPCINCNATGRTTASDKHGAALTHARSIGLLKD